MEVKDLSLSKIKLVKRFDKPIVSAQGMAIYGDLIFQLYHTGYCGVFDLDQNNTKPLAFFPLGSVNEGNPTNDYLNHSNQCMFSNVHYKGNPIPLLYDTIGYGISGDENGFFYRCAVENIELEYDENGKVIGGKSTTLQVISYRNDGIENTPYEDPCWGCPAWFIDNDQKAIYMFSCRYRTTEAFKQYYDQNRFRITKFPLPNPEDGGFVMFTAKDIQDQFICPYDIMFTQGGMIKNGLLYYSFGLGDERYPLGLRVYDLNEKCLTARMDLSKSFFSTEEIESISYHDGILFCNTNAKPQGGYYSLGITEEDIRGKK